MADRLFEALSTAAHAFGRLGIAPARCDSTFVSGSVVRGWNHDLSDLDIYVVTDVPPDRIDLPVAQLVTIHPQVPPVPLFRLEVEGFSHADIELWSSAALTTVLELASVAVEQDCLDLLYRISIASPVQGRDWLAQYQNRLAESGLHAKVAREHGVRAVELHKDAQGMLRSGDLPSSLLSARESFSLAVDGLLAHEGDLCPSRKWQYRRVLESPGAWLSPRRFLDMVLPEADSCSESHLAALLTETSRLLDKLEGRLSPAGE